MASQDKIYVMSRPDGRHKIGISGNVDGRRRQVGAGVKLVKAFRPNGNVFMIEKLAHAEMAGVESYAEWFAADADACILAVRRAVEKFHRMGGADGYTKQREAKWRKNRKPRTIGGKVGAPGKEFTADQIDAFASIWTDHTHKTNRDALIAMGKPFGMVTANKLLGPSGRKAGPKTKAKVFE